MRTLQKRPHLAADRGWGHRNCHRKRCGHHFHLGRCTSDDSSQSKINELGLPSNGGTGKCSKAHCSRTGEVACGDTGKAMPLPAEKTEHTNHGIIEP